MTGQIGAKAMPRRLGFGKTLGLVWFVAGLLGSSSYFSERTPG